MLVAELQEKLTSSESDVEYPEPKTPFYAYSRAAAKEALHYTLAAL